jgi:hypothetical protein
VTSDLTPTNEPRDDTAAAPKPKRKYPSGASKRRKAHEKVDAYVATRNAYRKDTGRWASEFKKAGEPDLENPGTDLSYVRKLQLIVMRQMATTPFPTIAQQEAWRRIREMSAVVGMTSKRAELESTVKRLEQELRAARPEGAVKWVEGPVAKSPNARGAPTGPRPVKDEPDSERPAPLG